MSFMRQRFTHHVALLATAALALSACTVTTAAGVAKAPRVSRARNAAAPTPTAAAAYQLMRKSGVTATSVHIKGAYADMGQLTQLDVAGDCAGVTMRMLVDFGAGQIEVLKVNGDFYLKADAAYWNRLEGSAAITTSVAGRYVKVPAGSAAGMGDFRVATLLGRVLAEDVSAAAELNPKVQVTDVDGVPAYLMTTKAGGVKLYVSTNAQGRLLRAESAKTGTLNFTQWDSVEPTSPPPASQLAKTPSL
jgi:hypothetical protein